MRITGKAKSCNNAKGYGFIEHEAGSDVFVHFCAIQGDGFRTLEEGQAVEFCVVFRSHMPNALPRHALQWGAALRMQRALGATRAFTAGASITQTCL